VNASRGTADALYRRRSGRGIIDPEVRGLPATFWWLWTGMLVNRLGGFVYAFLALYLTAHRGFSPGQAGLVVALYGLGQTLAAPIGGVLADRIGRRATILLGTLGGATAMLQLGFATGTLHIVLSVALLGLVGDLYRPAVQASIADLVPPADRTRAFGYLYWAINLGWAFAATVAGIVAGWSFLGLFVGDAVTTLTFGAIIFLRVPDTRPDLATVARSGIGRDFLAPFRDRRLTGFLGTQFLVVLVFMQSPVALSLDMRAHGLSARTFGFLVALNGALIVVFQPLGMRILGRAHAPNRALALALAAVLTGIGFGVNGLAGGWPVYAVSVALWSAGEIVFSGVVPAVIAELSPPSLLGGYQGANNLSWGVATCAGPILGGAVLGHLGARALWGGCAATGLVAAALHLGRGPRAVRAAPDIPS
jgi:MFS family permease